MSEARLTTDTIKRFRQAYAAEFGAPAPSDDLYAAVSEGRRAIGLEHWLPLLYDNLDTIFDYVADAPFVLDSRAEEAATNASRKSLTLMRRDAPPTPKTRQVGLQAAAAGPPLSVRGRVEGEPLVIAACASHAV